MDMEAAAVLFFVVKNLLESTGYFLLLKKKTLRSWFYIMHHQFSSRHLLNAVSVGKHGIVLKAYLLYYIVCNKNKTLRNMSLSCAFNYEHVSYCVICVRQRSVRFICPSYDKVAEDKLKFYLLSLNHFGTVFIRLISLENGGNPEDYYNVTQII